MIKGFENMLCNEAGKELSWLAGCYIEMCEYLNGNFDLGSSAVLQIRAMKLRGSHFKLDRL